MAHYTAVGGASQHQEDAARRGVRNKEAMYILAAALAFSVFSVCSGQGINGYKAASWNSAGGRWRSRNNEISVPLLLTNYAVDVLALQEAGSLTRTNLQLQALPSNMNVLFLSVEQRGLELELHGFSLNPGVTEHVFRLGQHDFYLYYYNRDIAAADLAPGAISAPPRDNTRINIAIVSKYRADEVIFIEPFVDVKETNLTNVKRPVLGIRVGDAFFFSVHPMPWNTGNEAPLMINAIEKLMSHDYPTSTWMAMGDYNRTPQDLMNAATLLPPPRNMFRQIVATGLATRTRELDYAVVGGPSTSFVRNGLANTHTATHFRNVQGAMNIRNPSDHWPVIYNKPAGRQG